MWSIKTKIGVRLNQVGKEIFCIFVYQSVQYFLVIDKDTDRHTPTIPVLYFNMNR